jgi:hypothetical protein
VSSKRLTRPSADLTNYTFSLDLSQSSKSFEIMKTMANTVQVGELLPRPRKDRQFPDTTLARRRQILVSDGREVGDSKWEVKIRYQSTPSYLEPQKPKTLTMGLIFV